MNGQMYQIFCIAAAAKKALQEGKVISYIPLSYENRIEFQFLPEKKLFRTFRFKSANVATWYEHCLRKGMRDIKFLAPLCVDDRNILGFSNTTQSSLVCFFKNGTVSYFVAQWEFDSVQNVWNILYTEQRWENAPTSEPHFEDNTEEFKSILADICEFASVIECDTFALLFQNALDILSGEPLNTNTAPELPLPQIPQKNLRIFQAASTADVFGAMGSWNDSPPYIAHEKGLDQEYENLSGELLRQLRLSMLYAVNEGWDCSK